MKIDRGQVYFTALGFTETAPDVFTKTLTKKVEVAFHGEMESNLTVTFTFRDNGSFHIDYAKNGRSFKSKVYSFGWSKTIRAMHDTVEYAGFSLREEDAQ